jgi:hypothetical protein
MTKKEKTERCRMILYSTNDVVLHVSDFEFLLQVFEGHQEWEQKKGVGVDFISVGMSPYKTKCFFINRIDGSKTDISFGGAITNPKPIAKVKSACRFAIREEIANFRKANVVYNVTKCPFTDYVLTQNNTHIDHYDLTFDEMFNLWLGQEEISLDYLVEQIEETKDNEFDTKFKDNDIEIDFVRFHNANCKLRAVSSAANLSILRRKTFKQKEQ